MGVLGANAIAVFIAEAAAVLIGAEGAFGGITVLLIIRRGRLGRIRFSFGTAERRNH